MPDLPTSNSRPKIDPIYRLVFYVLTNAAIGALLGLLLAGVLMLTNAGGLGHLIHDTADPVTPVVLVLVGFATLFGGLYTAAAIMMMPPEQ
ncbi:MAG: hypothetical protein ABL904_18710 [Hyphomicrobiaceae bacterium]